MIDCIYISAVTDKFVYATFVHAAFALMTIVNSHNLDQTSNGNIDWSFHSKDNFKATLELL